MTINDEHILLTIEDTAGVESYDDLRLLSYPKTDVVVICYDITNTISLKEVSEMWIHEVREHAPNKPILLVANKRDRRDEMNPGDTIKCISTQEGQNVADGLNLAAFFETSALKDPMGLNLVFQEACRWAINQPTERQGQE